MSADAPAVSQPTQTRRKRGTELGLLILAIVVVLGAFTALMFAREETVPAPLIRNGLIFMALALVAHFVVSKYAPYTDPVLLPIAVLLSGLGIVMIHRLDLADIARAAQLDNDPPPPAALAQLTWLTLGLVLFIATLILVKDHRKLQKFTYLSMAGGLLLLVLPLVGGLGRELNGARIWISVAGQSFQPAEAAKILLLIFFAGYLVTARNVLALARHRVLGIDLPRARDLAPLLIVWLASLAILVFEKDLGTAIIFFGSFVMLIYVATERRSWLVLGALLVSVGATAAYFLFSHVKVRVDVWLDPFLDPDNRGYQMVQSLYGFAAGGLFGKGWGQGRPDLIPVRKSDFILAAFGEELGLVGLTAIILLYAVLVFRGLRTALALRDAFGTLLAAGLSFITGIQIFVVVGGVSGLIPLTGLTTPFLSAGGSSLVANWVIIALLIRMSNAARTPAKLSPTSLAQDVTQVVRL